MGSRARRRSKKQQTSASHKPTGKRLLDAQPSWISKYLKTPLAWLLTVPIAAMIVALAQWAPSRYGPIIEDQLQDELSSEPLRIIANYERQGDQGQTWAVPKRLEVTAAQAPLDFGRTSIEEFERWVKENGGVDVEISHVKLIVEGMRHDGVLITGMRARIVRRNAPLSKTLFWGAGEGATGTVNVGFDLDDIDPIARRVAEDLVSFEEPYFASHAVTLKKGEQIVFNVMARTERCDCSWEIVMDTVVKGRKEIVTVRNGPTPFRVTALAPEFAMYEAIYRGDLFANRFVPVDPTEFCTVGNALCSEVTEPVRCPPDDLKPYCFSGP